MARVLVVESWDGGSHRWWHQAWHAQSRHDLQVVGLPDRNWRWRLRGGAVALADLTAQHVAANGRPDVVVVSSLVDVAAFVALARRSIGGLPTVAYMHENQLLYPTAPNQSGSDEYAFMAWKGLLAADAVWWNSAFHRDALLDALDGLLARQPDAVEPWSAAVRARSVVAPPGVETRELVEAERQPSNRPTVLWNQRWDHDKAPAAVFRALAAAADQGLDFELVLAGEDNGRHPDTAAALAPLEDHISHRGYLDRASYLRQLLAADVVISAATHEFFGIAIVEAIAAGAVPVLPDRLSFPEIVGEYRAGTIYPDGALRRRVAQVLGDLQGTRTSIVGLRSSMLRYDVVESAARHDDAVDALVV